MPQLTGPAGSSFGGGVRARGQVLLVVLTWLYLCGLHTDNDGLWYQGDAPRHAANGLFWKDFLQARPAGPREYALRYYARYPVILPTAYPPAFYLLEAAAYSVFGPSPYVAKGLVLCFALPAGLYTTAWLRRWVSPEAGWAGALVPLLPGVVVWSHAVMLNVPAFALCLGALYHARRWLESPPAPAPASRHLYAAAGLGMLAVLTYYPAGLSAFVVLAWLGALRRADLLYRRQTLVVLALCAVPVLGGLLVVTRWAPTLVGYVRPMSADIWTLDNWLSYARDFDEILSPHLLGLAAVGVVAGLLGRRWRRETMLLLVWIGVLYVLHTLIEAKEPRYLLLLSTPLVCLGAIGVVALADGLAARFRARAEAGRRVVPGTLLALLLAQVWLAAQQRVPAVKGFAEVARFLARQAPDEPVLYTGHDAAVFTFYVLAGDPDHRRRVVRGERLLSDIRPQGLRILATSTVGLLGASAGAGPLLAGSIVLPGRDGVWQCLEILQARAGCRWLAMGTGEPPYAPTVRRAAQGPQFEFVHSFPAEGMAGLDRVEVYRLLVPVERQEEVDIPLPTPDGPHWLRVRPIPPRNTTGEGSRRPPSDRGPRAAGARSLRRGAPAGKSTYE